MIFFKRRRLLTWLIKAYVKKHGKTILLFFIAGLVAFSLLILTKDFFIEKIPFTKKETIGLIGSYDVNNLPSVILQNISKGLTSISENGQISGAVAKSWKIDKGGREYTFYIKNNIYFSDGTKLTSKDINYGFSDAAVSRPNDYQITFLLKDNYSPFLVTVSRPIFKKGFVGISDYAVNNIKLNGNFVESIELFSKKDKNILNYQFYPTDEALKSAFVMGEVSEAMGLTDIKFNNSNFSKFKSVTVKKSINEGKLVTLFYNTKDAILSDNRIRKALTYALPDIFSMGQRNSFPFSPNSWAQQSTMPTFTQDFDHTRLLLSESSASSSATLKLKIKTLPQYKQTAQEIVSNWKKVNVQADIEVVDSIPSSFQIFLGDFNLSKDPDEYSLWHSDQPSNITRYKNLRIDKLLEDGRKEIDQEARKKIYASFQKYLLDDSPASFLYMPYSYDVSR